MDRLQSEISEECIMTNFAVGTDSLTAEEVMNVSASHHIGSLFIFIEVIECDVPVCILSPVILGLFNNMCIHQRLLMMKKNILSRYPQIE